MVKDVLIFVPKDFSTEKTGPINGFFKKFSSFQTYYITKSETHTSCDNHIGYVGKVPTGEFIPKNTIYIEPGGQTFKINDYEDGHNITEILYDLDSLQNSVLNTSNNYDYGLVIKELMYILTKNKKLQSNGNDSRIFVWCLFLISTLIKIFSKLRPITKTCALLTHVESNIHILLWFTQTLKKEKKMTTSLKNVCVTRTIDFLLGVGIFYLCLKYKSTIMSQFHYMTQDFVTHLRELLIYLMGSPIGLKLNYALNHSLGIFFFYHINLWQVFLQAMEPLLENHFKLMLLPALFGFSYQVAIVCDIISLGTFHIYCIYVYAARLFLLQIRSLISLWRLFTGRKFNPLRFRVDSCEYSSNQLFIGTLGFTVMLFLLPTTTMYYTVFAAFRLITLIAFLIFNKLKDFIFSIPLYIVMLWVLQSSTISGNIYLELRETASKRTQVEAKLRSLSIGQSIKKFSLAYQEFNNPILVTRVKLGSIILRLFSGQLV